MWYVIVFLLGVALGAYAYRRWGASAANNFLDLEAAVRQLELTLMERIKVVEEKLGITRSVPLILFALLCLPMFAISQSRPSAGVVRQKPSRATARGAATLRPAAAALPAGTPTGINTTWTPAYPLLVETCPTNAPVSCVLGHELTLTLPDGTQVVVPAGDGAGELSAAAAQYLWQPGGQIPYGLYRVSVITVAYDENGAREVSLPATASVVNALTSVNPPTGVTATVVHQ